MPADQAWQPALWRELLGTLTAGERAGIRPQLHRRFVDAMASDAPDPDAAARAACVLFGMSHVPTQTMEVLAALSRRAQVLLAVPNPCRFHWADIIEGRALLRAPRRRHPLRRGRDLAEVPLEDMHLHGASAAGRVGTAGRDFIRQLDAFDD